ncbi:TPA: hypothetical protein ACOTGW_002720 [Clostridium perfringens]|nr:hypothetical protein [Clostridium perfringens]NGU48073.1 hypothetical protein [Clostridium perfringens]
MVEIGLPIILLILYLIIVATAIWKEEKFILVLDISVIIIYLISLYCYM